MYVTDRADNHQTPVQDFKNLQSGEPAFTRNFLMDQITATDDFEELTGPIAERVTVSGLKSSEILNLRKLIAKKTKVSVKTLDEDAKRFKAVPISKDAFHLYAAQEAINSYGEGNLIFSSDFFWNYKNGLWAEKDDRAFKQRIHKIYQTAKQNMTKNTVASTLDLAKTEAFCDNHQFNTGGQYAINCLNGEVHLEDGVPIFKDHNREHFRTAQIPVAYDKDAQAPRFEQFLKEIFINDPDRDQKIQLLLEMVGYTMTTSCSFEKFIILLGPGANGKSVLLTVLQVLLGPGSVCSVKPNQLDNKFQRGHLHAKLANIVTEIEEGAVIADAELKSLTSGELTTAEHKFKNPFDFIPYATFWFATNHMPHTRDFSDALFRRAFIITFNRVFTETEQDKGLKQKLLKELPGILHLAIDAFALVLMLGKFTKVPSSETAKREWLMEADQVAQYVEECCRLEKAAKTPSQEIYRNYLGWAEVAGIKRTLNRKNFTQRLERLGITKSRGVGGVRMLCGITITTYCSDFST